MVFCSSNKMFHVRFTGKHKVHTIRKSLLISDKLKQFSVNTVLCSLLKHTNIHLDFHVNNVIFL